METLKYVIDLMLHLDRELAGFIQEYGVWTYALLVLIVFCETGLVVTPFLPGDSLLFAAGILAGNGALSLPLVILLLIVAAVLGDSVNYAIGQFLGNRLLSMKRQLIRREHLQMTADFFEEYGGKTIVIARFVPIVRTLAPFVAGMGTMRYHRFMLYNVAGGVLWVVGCTLAGYWLGRFQIVKEHFSLAILAVVAVSLLPAVYEWWRHRRVQRMRASAAAGAATDTPVSGVETTSDSPA